MWFLENWREKGVSNLVRIISQCKSAEGSHNSITYADRWMLNFIPHGWNSTTLMFFKSIDQIERFALSKGDITYDRLHHLTMNNFLKPNFSHIFSLRKKFLWKKIFFSLSLIFAKLNEIQSNKINTKNVSYLERNIFLQKFVFWGRLQTPSFIFVCNYCRRNES